MDDAIFGLIGVVIGSLSTIGMSLILQKRQFDREDEKENKNVKLRSQEQAKEILLEMLNHKDHIERRMDTLNRNIGEFSHDSLRDLLLSIGAKRSQRTDGEWWYLIERQPELIQKRKLKRNKKSDNSQDAS